MVGTWRRDAGKIERGKLEKEERCRIVAEVRAAVVGKAASSRGRNRGRGSVRGE